MKTPSTSVFLESIVCALLFACGGSGSKSQLAGDGGEASGGASGKREAGVAVDAGGIDRAASSTSDTGTAGSVDAAVSDAAVSPVFVFRDGGPSMDMAATDASPAQDAGACKIGGACDPFGPNSCAMGQTCAVDKGAGLCAKSVGMEKREGELCQPPQSFCAQGTTCLIDSDGKSRCTKLCPKGSRGACGPDARCFFDIGEGCAMACRAHPSPCDYYDQGCAATGFACYPVTDPETRETSGGCQIAGAMGEGQACARFNDCAKGLMCVGTRCVRLCRPQGQPACEGGKMCTGVTTALKATFCQ